MDDDLASLLSTALSPIEHGRRNFDFIMESGTDAQREVVLMMLNVVGLLKPGPRMLRELHRCVVILEEAQA
jgi:hypothetical protein